MLVSESDSVLCKRSIDQFPSCVLVRKTVIFANRLFSNELLSGFKCLRHMPVKTPQPFRNPARPDKVRMRQTHL